MIKSLYTKFQHWSANGSIYIISDTHFEDADTKLMDKDWVEPEEQVQIINRIVQKGDTLIHLGDVGNPIWMKQIKAGYKVLLMGNHDQSIKKYEPYFDEIYQGPLFIAEKILLSHEPVYGLSWCLNIHGHDHNNTETYKDGCKHINMATNVCSYTPINLGEIIKKGIISDISSLHRLIINNQTEKKHGDLSKRALKAAKIIMEYCKSINGEGNDCCAGCIFDSNDPDGIFWKRCILNDPDHLPETWQIEKLEEEL